jgi:hypothetical protein
MLLSKEFKMTTKFELLNQKRNRYRGAYLVALAVFFITWIARSALRLSGGEDGMLGDALLILMYVCLGIQTFFVVKEVRLKMEMKQDPALREMMNDELVRLNELKAWRTAFFALIGYICLMVVLSLIIDFPDLGRVLVTGLLVGFGAYGASAYWLNR